MLFIAVSIVHVMSCILLIIAVLLQSGKDAGLSGAFGAGGGQAIFGARAGDVLTKATLVLAVIFISTCLLFTRIRPGGGRSVVRSVAGGTKAVPGREERKTAEAAQPGKMPAPAAPAAPVKGPLGAGAKSAAK